MPVGHTIDCGNLTKQIEIVFGLWTRIDPRGLDHPRGVIPIGAVSPLNRISLCSVQSANTAAHGCRLVHRVQHIMAHAKLHYGLTKLRGDKCGDYVAFCQNLLSTCCYPVIITKWIYSSNFICFIKLSLLLCTCDYPYFTRRLHFFIKHWCQWYDVRYEPAVSQQHHLPCEAATCSPPAGSVDSCW